MARSALFCWSLLALATTVSAQSPNSASGLPVTSPVVSYRLSVDSTDLSGFQVVIHLQNLPDTFRLAMAAHPEYDDRYWRYLEQLTVETPAGAAGVSREDSALWRVVAPGGVSTVRYRIHLPPAATTPRAAWRPFLAATGGLFGGPHSFMYVLGAERAAARVELELPPSWQVATALVPTSKPGEFLASSVDELVDSPILAGPLHHWAFQVDSVRHRVIYWPGRDAAPFDSTAFVAGIERLARQVMALFGPPPYREYTFLFLDDSYGALEHMNSVTLGAPSADLAKDPNAALEETAHEFFHTWNLMRIRPVEYRAVDYRTQPPVAGLWFSEGFTMFYADLLLRRARLPQHDSTRLVHLEGLIARYLGNPGEWRFSAEAVSRVAFNSHPGALGDYEASTHLQGELLGTMLDLIIRDATHGDHSMDDVMRLMLPRFSGEKGFDGQDVERTVEEVCRCEVTPLFDAYIRNGGKRIDFDRYLGLIGLRTQVQWKPAMDQDKPRLDLRIFAWKPPGEPELRLTIVDPESVWGRAGLHSGDRLLSVNGAAPRTWGDFRNILRGLVLGDTVRMEVGRGADRQVTTVVATGYIQPVVRIVPLPGATPAQRALRDRWLAGH